MPPKTDVAKPKAPKKVAASHPPYNEMVIAAITALKERSGSSRQAILKYIQANNSGLKPGYETHAKMALKRLVAKGTLVQPKGTGASGSFKIGKVEKPEKKPVAKKPAPKKVAEKPKKPATPKKPAAKATTKPKKTTTKKATTAKPKTIAKPKKPAVKATKAAKPKKTTKATTKPKPRKASGAKKTAKTAPKSPKK